MTKVFTFIIAVVFSVTTVLGQLRIIGGNEAPPAFGLFHASLQNLTGYHVCGGAIVSRWHVLTAAHCLKGANPEFIKVVVGTTCLNKGGIQYDTESLNIYNSFNFTSKVNDIALLKVKEPFDLNYVKIIPLSKDIVIEGDIVFLSGFGAKMVNGASSDQMHVLTIPVFSQNTCRYAMRYTREVTRNMFCTFTKIGQGTCNEPKLFGAIAHTSLQVHDHRERARYVINDFIENAHVATRYNARRSKGDSGSPIIKDDKLVGVVSWGIPCAVGFPDVHTRVAPFYNWIRSEIRKDIC